MSYNRFRCKSACVLQTGVCHELQVCLRHAVSWYLIIVNRRIDLCYENLAFTHVLCWIYLLTCFNISLSVSSMITCFQSRWTKQQKQKINIMFHNPLLSLYFSRSRCSVRNRLFYLYMFLNDNGIFWATIGLINTNDTTVGMPQCVRCEPTLAHCSMFTGTLPRWAKIAVTDGYPDSKVHGANVGPIWGRQDPGGTHVGPMNFAIWVSIKSSTADLLTYT